MTSGEEKESKAVAQVEPVLPVAPNPYAASVELPEGHQLIIGDLPPGTILEVATWEGVGRPDETTKRFLLSSDGPGIRAPIGKPTVAELSPIERASDATVAAPFLGVTLPKVDTESASLDSRRPKNTQPRGLWRKAGKSLFLVVAIISILAMGLNVAGISATVPTIGSKTVFGSSNSSLVLYKRALTVAPNNPTVAVSRADGKKNIYLGKATVFSATEVGIATISGIVIVDPNTVAGKSVAVIPYIGWLIKPLLK